MKYPLSGIIGYSLLLYLIVRVLVIKTFIRLRKALILKRSGIAAIGIIKDVSVVKEYAIIKTYKPLIEFTTSNGHVCRFSPRFSQLTCPEKLGEVNV